MTDAAPHVALVGHGRGTSGVARSLKTAHPALKVLVVTEEQGIDGVMEAAAEGVEGFLSVKDLTPDLLVDCITHLKRHPVAIFAHDLLSSAAPSARRANGDEELTTALVERFRLSHREAQVLARLREGESNERIAAHLGIRLETAKKYVRRVLVKMGARSRTQAAVMATRRP